MNRVLSTLVLGVFFVATVSTAKADTLKDMSGIHSFALGNAITAKACGLESVYKNPAGLTNLTRSELKSAYTSLFDNSYYIFNLSYGLPLSENWVTAISVPIKIIPSIPQTKNTNGRAEQIGQFNDYETEAILSIGHHITNELKMGANITGYYQKILTQTSNGIGADFGLLYHYRSLSLGAAIQNIGNTKMAWTSGHQNIKPETINLGVGYTIVDNLEILADTNMSNNTCINNMGGEWHLNPALTLAAGMYDITSSQQLRLGLTLNLTNLTLSYAYSQHEYLGTIHGFSITLPLSQGEIYE